MINSEIDTDSTYRNVIRISEEDAAKLRRVHLLLRAGYNPQICFMHCKNSYNPNATMQLWAQAISLRKYDGGDYGTFMFVLFPHKQYDVQRQLKLYYFYSYSGTINPIAYIDNMSY